MSFEHAPYTGERARKLASKMVGDGGKPNRYFVTTSSSFMALDTSDPKFSCWTDPAEVDPAFKAFIIPRGETYGPYDTYRAAWVKFWEIYTDIEHEPTVRNGIHSVFIEDRLSGEIASGGLYAEKKQWGWRFHDNFHESTQFTSERLGFDIRQFNSRKEADEAHNKN